MPRYVAFLRAINVGGRNVRMEKLLQLFADHDLTEARSFIASGNVLFESRARPLSLEKKIAGFLEAGLGYRVDTFVRPLAGLAEIAGRAFLDRAESDTLHIGFLAHEPGAAARTKLDAWPGDIDEFAIHGREFYWLCHVRSSDSKFSGGVLEKMLGQPATLRNVTTVLKLADLA